ncbi:MAG: TIGR03986 family CRISPR-associated RAMP protein [Butyrivibrio sp.]|uniref:TIGR03986 family type III CRISPR-associated RAMP protein n=1 Tax=Butyrivibrio sp. TaxID=28121 RepID=UPI0025D5E8CF|nr:TIGR03986 family CRISPR-associated RAMP protein [Butyrivibrio sp.]MCR5772562.1 TIGR03986 family CRISPR-associated RAMP protein [Butyrivibrio sp.]
MYNFVNPYNFVPFGNSSPSTVSKEKTYRGDIQKELLSGWIDVTLHIKTPLIVPDGAHPKYWDLKANNYKGSKNEFRNPRDIHTEYDFLKIYNPETEHKEYAISGSELRGLIRSTYETVTNSCMPFLMSDKPMSQRVPLYGALSKRGLLGYDGERWVLYNTTKMLEEVIVVPLYEVSGTYYAETMDRIRNNKENKKLDKNHNFKYEIMNNLDQIESELKNYIYKGKQIECGALFVKNQKNSRKWDIKVSDQVKAREVDKNIVHYLFINCDGIVIKSPTGTYVNNKGWLQYNVPVDTSRIYHIAYLKKKDEVHRWQDSSAKGDENKEKKKDMLYAEAYKKLKSALHRDGAVGSNNNPNNLCNNNLKECLEDACNNKEKLVPVYYFIVTDNEKNEDIVYMSGSAAGRIAQRRKWKDIIKGHTPCENDLCPACLLFGTVKDGGMKGHVRFTDAFMTNGNEIKTSRHTLQVLSTPRTTAFEFYLKKPVNNATYWNYDFYGVTEYMDGGSESHTNYYHLENSMPRGRKMYWHNEPAKDDIRKTNLNSTMESLDKGSFTFKIYFDQISKVQLQDLIWTIELGDNDVNSKYQHKLGHGKPLGYGSVKLVVDGGKVRDFKNKDSQDGFGFKLKNLSEVGVDINTQKPSFNTDSEEVKKLLIMANSDTVATENVDYPRTDKNRPIYEWFAKNRTNPKSLSILPEPDESKLSLGEKKRILKQGDSVEVRFNGFAENKENKHVFGIFVKLPNGENALLHISNAKNNRLQEYEGTKFLAKIIEISEKNGKKRYSITDKI